MRATRAYLAGFGTSGSLLAGAAIMFVLASAIVGFHGWPQVGGQNPIANVAAPRLTLSPSSPTSRILAALSSRTLVAGLPGTTPAAHGGAPGDTGGAARHSQSIGGGAIGQGSPSTPGTRPTICPGPACVTTVSSTGSSGIVSTASKALSGAGAQAGTTVSQLSNSAANAVAPVSPAAANVIRQIGGKTAHAVTGTSNTLAGVVSHTTGVVSQPTRVW